MINNIYHDKLYRVRNTITGETFPRLFSTKSACKNSPFPIRMPIRQKEAWNQGILKIVTYQVTLTEIPD